MPGLDVSFVVVDPLLADTFSVTRRAEQISSKGRTEIVETVFPDQKGTVTIEGDSSRTPSEDGQIMPRRIVIVSRFSFREAVVGFQPDEVLWRGGRYLLKSISPYQHFGDGFTSAILESVTMPDPPRF